MDTDKTRLERLRELRDILYRQLTSDEPGASVAQLARQYRETLVEIETLEATASNADGLDGVLG